MSIIPESEWEQFTVDRLGEHNWQPLKGRISRPERNRGARRGRIWCSRIGCWPRCASSIPLFRLNIWCRRRRLFLRRSRGTWGWPKTIGCIRSSPRAIVASPMSIIKGWNRIRPSGGQSAA